MATERRDFWGEVLSISGSVTPYVLRRVAIFGMFGAIVWIAASFMEIGEGMGVAPHGFIGAVMALLLVLRTNSGYDRWYEGRKLWGGIVNQSRNLCAIGTAYGPNDRDWRDLFLRWTAAFPHLARHSLRGERDLSDMKHLLPAAEIEQLEKAVHMPLHGSVRLAQLLSSARDRELIDGFAFLRADDQRGQLIDHIGACERIMKTPLAKVMSIKVRRFLFMYLLVLPVAIVDQAGALTPLLTMLVAYPLLSLDQIGIELENPFSKERLSHLPLDRICQDIEGNVMAFSDRAAEAPRPVTTQVNGQAIAAAAQRAIVPQVVH